MAFAAFKAFMSLFLAIMFAIQSGMVKAACENFCLRLLGVAWASIPAWAILFSVPAARMASITFQLNERHED